MNRPNLNRPILKAWTAALAFPMAGFFLASTARAAEAPDSEHVAKLLSEAKTMAFQVKEDAVAMEGFNRMKVGKEAHANAINDVRDHVNALEVHAAKLRAVRDEASPWQRAAIDRITPFLDELEGYTAAIIERVADNPKALFTPEYKDFLEANADYATDLAAMIADFVDYGKTKDRVQKLADKLELPKVSKR